MLNESKKRCALIEQNHVNLQVKFQKYKECLQNQRVCDTSNSTASNAIFEINKLKDQLQGKDDTIRNLQSGKKSSGSTASEKPKVLASGMYTNSSKTKPATESRKPMPKSHTRNNHILPNKSVNARRAAYHNRKLNVVDHNQFVIRSLKYVNTNTPYAKHSVNHTKKVWKATRNHNVKPQWKPTGRLFALYDNCPLTRIMEPIVEPLELTLRVSSSSKVTMISRSKGRTVADSIAERLTRPTAYKFKTDCSIIPVW
ncbi:hypothetical protein Tco_1326045, partial [Tanacetum coccineum]